jgi:glycosyltransferase involved in cell wall biosynthesis
MKNDKTIRVLMVTTEYPPMPGGVGRYTAKLTNSLLKTGIEVYVVCNEKGKGDYQGLSTDNKYNSDVLLKATRDSKADIVHIQYEPGLYGLVLDPFNPHNTTTNIDSFYYDCKTPIVTTFHSAYTFKQWMNLASITESTSKVYRYINFLTNSWKRLLNYKSFHNLNKEKQTMSKASIVFSNYLGTLITGDTHIAGGSFDVIYHGSELLSVSNKRDSRSMFSLPQDRRIALALGFKTATKGWDMLDKINVPDDWLIVVNPSKNNYNTNEKVDLRFKNESIVDLQKDFLDETELSCLFYAADATILPYTISSGSGVMFDGLAHSLPFVASDLPFFKEFSSKGLGITVKRKPEAFAEGLKTLAKRYDTYTRKVNDFKEKLKWDVIATQHALLYQRLSAEVKPQTVTLSSSRNNKQTK